LTIGGLAFGAGLALAGVWLALHPDVLRALRSWSAGESYLADTVANDASFLRGAAGAAGHSLLLAGLTLAFVAACAWFSRRWSHLRWAPLAVLTLEVTVFAGTNVATSPDAGALPAEYRSFAVSHSGDFRVLNLGAPNNGFLLGRSDIWGNDPALLRRYAELVTSAQGGDPDHAAQTLRFSGFTPALAMLRLQYALGPGDRGFHVETSPFPPLPRLLLVPEYRVVTDRYALLRMVNQDAFDPRKVVLLEQLPNLQATPASVGSSGAVRLIRETSDTLEIEAETPMPVVLLVTDAYSRDWHARSLEEGSQQPVYRVQPANHALLGVPLEAGHHHLMLEYVPPWLGTSLVLSIAAWVCWGVLWLRHRSNHALTSG